MKPAEAWNVKGVGADARETAREAARRAGLSVGEWLNSVIMESADEADRSAGENADARDFSAIHEHLDALATRLGKLRSVGKSRAGDRPGGGIGSDLRALETWLSDITKDLARYGEETPQRVADAINRLNERLDSLIASGQVAAGEFERRVTAVDGALDELNGETRRTGFKRRGEPTEDAISDIKTRQRALDAAPDRGPDEGLDRRRDRPGWRTPPSELDQHLRTLTRQLDMMHRPCGFEESVAALRHDLGTIGDALSKAMPRCALDALENEVQSLADRAGRGRGRHGDSAGIAAIERRLGKLHDALNELTPAENVGGLEAAVESLSHKIDVLATGGPDAGAVQHLERAIAELRGLTKRVASGEALAVLACEVRTLAERMDRFAASAGKNAVSSLERRLEALSDSINARTAEAGRAVSARLEPLLNTLSAQLERLDLGGSDQAAIDHIEGEIAKLAEKIDASDARHGDIEPIERALADLFLQIEETRANAVEASEFKRDLADLRLTQTEAELRTQQTLEAVQETVERLANRLAAMENGAHTAPANRPPAAAPRAQAAVPSPPKPPAAQGPTPSAPATAAAERTAAMPAATPRAPINPGLPGNHPLEPGSTASRGRPAGPGERMAGEGSPAPVKPATPPEAGDKANFIAAARRAAQAAAADAIQPGAKRVDDKAPSGSGEAGDVLAKLKRPLVMSVAAAVLVVGAAHVTLSMLGPSSSARIDSPRQTAEIATPSAREPAKAATAPSASRGAEAGTAQSAAAPVPGPQLFAPSPVANSGVAGAANPPASFPDVTGSVAKANGGTPSTPGSAPAAAPADDSLPAAIAGPGLRAAAAAGNPAAEYEIALRYAEGRGVPQSLSEAARWLERAAAQGLAPAQYRLGNFYEKGNGVKKDLEAARRLYTAAADKGNARAMHNLAVLYAEGIDGKPEYKTAAQWFRRAAAFGIADSQYNLGILYARGIGVEQNLAESYKWFALAAQQGDQDAGRKRDDLANRLDPHALVAAKLAAQTFTAESQPDEATTVTPAGDSWDRPAASTPAAKSKSAGRRI